MATRPITMNTDDDKLATDDDGIIAEARARMQLCIDANDDDRAKGLEDLQFRNGDQWDAASVIQRDLDGRPHLTNNNLPAIVHQVTNDVRQNKQAIHVAPVDEYADPEVADVIEGLIRHIEYDSAADAAYDTAVESAANVGFGFFRLITEYCNPLSFDQDMKIKRIRNAFTVYIDPNAQEADGSDMQYGFITSKLPKIQFKLDYPGAEVTTEAVAKGTGDGYDNWIGADYVRVAEYYRIEQSPATLALLSDGTARLATDRTPLPAGVYPTGKTRRTLTRKIMWYKLTCLEILEKAEVPFDWIPIFPVYGDEIDLDGEVTRSGIIRFAKDPVTMYNYWLTAATEEIALRTKTPYIGAVGQFEGVEQDWQNANNRSFAYLEYNPVTVDGSLAPAPQRQPPADVPSGYIAMAGIARDNVKAVTGIYDASLGNRSNEISGIAIKSRQHQGELANFHISDNLDRAIRHLGRCIVSGIKRVYDSERTVPVMSADGKVDNVAINKPLPEPQKDPKTGRLRTVLNDLTAGEFGVVVSSGPAYNTAREQATDTLLQVGKDWPRLYDLAGDKVLGGLPFSGAEKLGERIGKKLGISDDEEDQPPVVQTPKGPISIQQAGQMIGQMDEALDKMNTDLEQHEAGITKAKLDNESRERIAEINANARHDDTELKGMIEMLTMKLDPILAHQAAVVAANDEDHPAPPPEIAQGVEQAPAEVEAADQGHEQALEQQEAAQPEPDAGDASAPEGT